MPPCWANAHGGLAIRPQADKATPPHPYKPLELGGGAPPPSRSFLFLYQKLGPSRHFPLTDGARNPPTTSNLHNFHVWCLNLTNNYFMWSKFHVDNNAHLSLLHPSNYCASYACLNLRNPGSPSQAIAIQCNVPWHRPTQIAIFPSSHLRLRCSWAL
jgi:hypothetical protein